MRRRPILFSTHMVQSILEGRKKQTRRTTGLNYINSLGSRINYGQCHLGEHMDWTPRENAGFHAYFGDSIADDCFVGIKCPYATHAGDLIWVREEHYRFGHWVEKEGVFTKTGRQKWMFVPTTDEVLFDAPEQFRKGRHHKDPYTPAWHKRLARFMPYSACRLFLRITDVRVERLQEITPGDAVDEGIEYWNVDQEAFEGGEFVADYNNYTWRDDPEYEDYHFPSFANSIDSFRTLWQSINGPDSWQANPWVWVIKFEKIEKPVNV